MGQSAPVTVRLQRAHFYNAVIFAEGVIKSFHEALDPNHLWQPIPTTVPSRPEDLLSTIAPAVAIIYELRVFALETPHEARQ